MGIPGRDAEGGVDRINQIEALAVRAAALPITQADVTRITKMSRRREDQARLAKLLRQGHDLLAAGLMHRERRGPGIEMIMHVRRLEPRQALYAAKLALAETLGLLDCGEELMTLFQAEMAAGIRDGYGVVVPEFEGVAAGGAV